MVILMAMLPITKISSIADLNKLSENQSISASEPQIPFKSMFTDAVNNVKETDAVYNQEVYKLATGQTDDLHNVMVASSKATMSIELLVQLRNKALDAYNDIMRINV